MRALRFRFIICIMGIIIPHRVLRRRKGIMYINCLSGHVAIIIISKRVVIEIISNDGHN